MNKKLSKRLSACLSALSSHTRIADIGTDHAYLPCYGVANGLIESAIAIDVIDGPLMQAKATIADYGLSDKIELRKGSGLEPLLVGEVEAVNIAGMGGKLIAQLILASLPVAKSLKTLVLQPQAGEYYLRHVLITNGFSIANEQLIEDEGIIYTIITAIPSLNRLSLGEEDIFFGPFLRLKPKCPLFQKKWQDEIYKIDEVLAKIPTDNERREIFIKRKAAIMEVINND